MKQDTVNVAVEADTRAFDDAMKDLRNSTIDFGRVFTNTISGAVRSGKGFEDSLRKIGQRLTDLALDQALKPLESLFGSFLSGLAGPASSGVALPGFSKGAAFDASGIVPFARGGVVSSPVAFGFGKELGVMGEAGAEAVMPLQRGADGRLGVASNGAASSPNIVFNVQTNDAASFAKSEAQITAMLARAVARGKRSL